MKAYIVTETLAAALKRLQRIASKRTSLPILNSFRLVAEYPEKLTIEVTDAEMSASIEIKADQVLNAGEIIIPAAVLGALVFGTSEEVVIIETDPHGNAIIDLGSKPGRYPAYPPEEWVKRPYFTPDATFKFDGDELRKALKTAAKFAHHDETAEPGMSCVGIFVRSGKSSVVASDRSYCAILSVASSGSLPNGDDKRQILIPASSASEIASMLPEGEVEISFNDRVVSVSGSETSISCQLSNAQFLPVESVFKKAEASCNASSKIDAKKAHSELSIITQMAMDKMVDSVEATFTKSSMSLDYKDARVEHNASVKAEGDAFSIKASARRIAAILSEIGSDSVSVHVNKDDDFTVVIFKAEGVDGMFGLAQMKQRK